MAIDRDAVRQQIEAAKKRQAGGPAQRFPKRKSTNIRIIGFPDAEGKEQFARTVVMFRKAANNKETVLDRQQTYGAPCAATRIHEQAQADGVESPFSRRQTQYFVNGIDISQKQPVVKVWALPTTV